MFILPKINSKRHFLAHFLLLARLRVCINFIIGALVSSKGQLMKINVASVAIAVWAAVWAADCRLGCKLQATIIVIVSRLVRVSCKVRSEQLPSGDNADEQARVCLFIIASLLQWAQLGLSASERSAPVAIVAAQLRLFVCEITNCKQSSGSSNLGFKTGTDKFYLFVCIEEKNPILQVL